MKIARKFMKIFGSNAGPQQRGKFGSLAAGLPEFATDPEDIQSLSNYETGWYGAILGNNSPAIQDMNALQFLYAYQLAYGFQSGIPEWNAETTYYIGSFVSDNGTIYRSIADDNLNESLSDDTKWEPAITLASLSTPVTQCLVPVGAWIGWPADTAPDGYLICDGAAISRTTYSALFAAIGTAHGDGDGSTTFNIPDYRGRFIRGVDGGSTRDTYRAQRTAMNPGGNTGASVGAVTEGYYTARSTQVGMIAGSAGAHTHGTNVVNNQNQPSAAPALSGIRYGTTGDFATKSSGDHTHSINSGGDAETAPKSATSNFIIKY